ncbi:hypothetical protein JW998_11540 [candidate division KSB1 bacterium]|nr:hypothetical protein [candidate division KSB1 bacterium]
MKLWILSYRILGQHEKTIIDKVYQRGIHNVRLEANDLRSGVHLCRMTAAFKSYTDVCKLVVMK